MAFQCHGTVSRHYMKRHALYTTLISSPMTGEDSNGLTLFVTPASGPPFRFMTTAPPPTGTKHRTTVKRLEVGDVLETGNLGILDIILLAKYRKQPPPQKRPPHMCARDQERGRRRLAYRSKQFDKKTVSTIKTRNINPSQTNNMVYWNLPGLDASPMGITFHS